MTTCMMLHISSATPPALCIQVPPSSIMKRALCKIDVVEPDALLDESVSRYLYVR